MVARGSNVNSSAISLRESRHKMHKILDRGEQTVKNWRSISLIDVNLKTISKALAARLKDLFSS